MSEIHRTIKAFLYPNTMKNAKGTYIAQTSKYQTYNIREIIINGEKIKITGDDPKAGLYLIHTESCSEMHFSESKLYKNGNAKIMLIVPELLPGNYQLKITTQYGGKGKPLAQSRSCVYGNLLQVD